MNEKELGQEHGTGILTNIYLLKANNRNTRKRFHDVILVFLLLHLNISYLFLLFLLLTLNK